MAMVESASRHRDALPSINHLDLDKAKSDRVDLSRFPMMAGLTSISTAPLPSPTAIYTGPPPPYSYVSTVTTPAPAQSGYTSPPEPARPAAKDEKEPVGPRRSLPSISEALGQDKAMAFAPPVTTAQSTAPSHQPLLTPSSAVGHSFPEGPAGPSNPFSQPSSTGAPLRDHGYRNDTDPIGQSFSNLNATEPRPQHSQTFGVPRSPKFNSGAANAQMSSISANASNSHSSSTISPVSHTPYRSPFSFSHQTSATQASPFKPATDPFHSAPTTQYDEQKRFNSKSGYGQSHGESVKRHLEVFDTQLAFHEIVEASAHNHNFAHEWAQRAHQAPRTAYFGEVLPELPEVDDALHRSMRITENLTRIKNAVIAQQNALAEQRARAVKGDYYEDDYNGLHDDYKANGGFVGSDAKKRRGKAAPPGRCHSCNRAETPEWRRGPDGARTLCNACGLHYAKLTRKMGVNKASSLAGSNLRPKNHDPRSPH